MRMVFPRIFKTLGLLGIFSNKSQKVLGSFVAVVYDPTQEITRYKKLGILESPERTFWRNQNKANMYMRLSSTVTHE